MYTFSIDVWSADNYTLKMDTGGNSPGGGNLGNDQGGNTNPSGGPKWKWHPFKYGPHIKEKGHYETFTASPETVLETYNPADDIPPMNDRQLGLLVDYRYETLYVSPNKIKGKWITALDIFPSDSLVDKIARERLLAHIYDYRSDLPTAYKELELGSGAPNWENLWISSYIINSLNNSQN